MGLFKMSTGNLPSTNITTDQGQPNPSEFVILEIFEKNNMTLAIVNYPNCTNYEGLKVMVYIGNLKTAIEHSTFLDPHFLEKGLSPFARFEPTMHGIKIAKAMLGL